MHIALGDLSSQVVELKLLSGKPQEHSEVVLVNKRKERLFKLVVNAKKATAIKNLIKIVTRFNAFFRA